MNEEIDRGMLKSVVLLQTVVPVVWTRGEWVLPTVQVLVEVVKKHMRRERGIEPKRSRETRKPKPMDMIREVRREGWGAAHGECGCPRF